MNCLVSRGVTALSVMAMIPGWCHGVMGTFINKRFPHDTYDTTLTGDFKLVSGNRDTKEALA